MPRFKLIAPLFLAAILLVAAPAHAQTSRVYFAGYMGLTNMPAMDFSESTTNSSGNLEYDNGWSFAGALGLRLSKNVRLEGEISYSHSDLDRITLNGAGDFKAAGDLTQWLGMANVYYDFDTSWRLQPFVSAGLGVAKFEAGVNDIAGIAADSSGSATTLAWQLGLGAKYRLSSDLALSGGYRWLDVPDLDIGSYTVDYGNHEIRFGLEYDLPVAGDH
jgi:opacity protein-like surface antigen